MKAMTRRKEMGILKLRPACKDYLWGGHRLADDFHIDYEGEILAEAWVLSCHPDGPSVILNGSFAGKTLQEYLNSEGMDVLGTHCRRFREFPILTKFIDARDSLSIQVHPGNAFALQNEGQYGKTEMWYVLDAEEGAFPFRRERELADRGYLRRAPDDDPRKGKPDPRRDHHRQR
jgi:mannose-6-phosphate isomerase class I